MICCQTKEDSNAFHWEKAIIRSFIWCHCSSPCLIAHQSCHPPPACPFPSHLLCEYSFPLVACMMSFSHVMTNWKFVIFIHTAKSVLRCLCRGLMLHYFNVFDYSACFWMTISAHNVMSARILKCSWHFPTQTCHLQQGRWVKGTYQTTQQFISIAPMAFSMMSLPCRLS